MDLYALTPEHIAILVEYDLDPCTATPDECFNAFLEWEGLHNYVSWIKRMIRLCYGLEVQVLQFRRPQPFLKVHFQP